jgi:hypothetical protein
MAEQWRIQPGQPAELIEPQMAVFRVARPGMPTPIGPIIAAILAENGTFAPSDLLDQLEALDAETGERAAVVFRLGRPASPYDLSMAGQFAMDWDRQVVVDEMPAEERPREETAGA